MQKTALALALAAVLAVAANPAFAHCGGAHGKSYRAAKVAKKRAVAKAARKPAVAEAAKPVNEAPAAAATTGLDTSTGFIGNVGAASNV